MRDEKRSKIGDDPFAGLPRVQLYAPNGTKHGEVPVTKQYIESLVAAIEAEEPSKIKRNITRLSRKGVHIGAVPSSSAKALRRLAANVAKSDDDAKSDGVAKRRGRPRIGADPMTSIERMRRSRAAKAAK